MEFRGLILGRSSWPCPGSSAPSLFFPCSLPSVTAGPLHSGPPWLCTQCLSCLWPASLLPSRLSWESQRRGLLRCSQVFQNENVRDYGDWQQEKLAFCHGELKGIQQEIRAGLRKSKGPLVITFFFFGWVVIKMDSKKLEIHGVYWWAAGLGSVLLVKGRHHVPN